MPLTTPTVSTDAAKLAALRRVKLIAAALLALCVAVFAAAKLLEPRWPALGFLAAFAEAATIGGIADWYAVVALFRRPLGLPIPHTAIIPANQDRLADNLGRFIEVNFLAEEPIRRKLKEVDFAALVADWLSDATRASDLSRFVAKLVPKALGAVEQSGLPDFVGKRLMAELDKIDVAPLAAGLFEAFTADGRHQKLLDTLVRMLGDVLSDEQTLAMIRDRIRDELPTLFRVFRADAYLLRKIVASAASLLDQVSGDPEHPVRKEFDEFVATFIDRLRNSDDYRRRAAQMKRDLLARPEVERLAAGVWGGLRGFLEKDAVKRDSLIRQHLANMFVEIGRELKRDRRIRADMNQGFVVALTAFVESQKSGVSTFIADQVKRWDLNQLTRLIEVNVGRDLQYIRFNGMIIGGLAGLALYAVERVLLVN